MTAVYSCVRILSEAVAGLPRACDLVIATAHPSPLSARRGFFGSRPFSRVNDWLCARGEAPVDWALTDKDAE